MSIVRIAAAMIALAGAATMAQAEDAGLRIADHNAAPELVRGDYARAERVLVASRRVTPNDADLLLNQALLYQRSGRVEEARVLYRQVLAQPDDAMLLTGDRWQSAHALARAGLRAGTATVVAATTGR